jgi:hypothetical protein
MRRKEGGERVRTGKEKKKETKPAQSSDKGNPEREREREREKRRRRSVERARARGEREIFGRVERALPRRPLSQGTGAQSAAARDSPHPRAPERRERALGSSRQFKFTRTKRSKNPDKGTP